MYESAAKWSRGELVFQTGLLPIWEAVSEETKEFARMQARVVLGHLKNVPEDVLEKASQTYTEHAVSMCQICLQEFIGAVIDELMIDTASTPPQDTQNRE